MERLYISPPFAVLVSNRRGQPALCSPRLQQAGSQHARKQACIIQTMREWQTPGRACTCAVTAPPRSPSMPRPCRAAAGPAGSGGAAAGLPAAAARPCRRRWRTQCRSCFTYGHTCAARARSRPRATPHMRLARVRNGAAAPRALLYASHVLPDFSMHSSGSRGHPLCLCCDCRQPARRRLASRSAQGPERGGPAPCRSGAGCRPACGTPAWPPPWWRASRPAGARRSRRSPRAPAAQSASARAPAQQLPGPRLHAAACACAPGTHRPQPTHRRLSAT